MKQLRLTKEKSETIGFVVSCIFADAIDNQELQDWAGHVLISAESYPLYLVDLCTFDKPLFRIYETIGFVPCSGLKSAQEEALVGIAYMRGRERYEPIPSREQALAALASHPRVLARFRETFPFIRLPDVDFAI